MTDSKTYAKDLYTKDLGTDPEKWAQALKRTGMVGGDYHYQPELEAWFKAALDAGRRSQAREAAKWMWRAAALYVNLADPETVAALVTTDEKGITHWHLPQLPISAEDATASTLVAADAADALDRIDTALDQFKPNLDDSFVRFVAATIEAHHAHRAQPQRMHPWPALASDVPMSDPAAPAPRECGTCGYAPCMCDQP